jgi:hypothetical protein
MSKNCRHYFVYIVHGLPLQFTVYCLSKNVCYVTHLFVSVIELLQHEHITHVKNLFRCQRWACKLFLTSANHKSTILLAHSTIYIQKSANCKCNFFMSYPRIANPQIFWCSDLLITSPQIFTHRQRGWNTSFHKFGPLSAILPMACLVKFYWG